MLILFIRITSKLKQLKTIFFTLINNTFQDDGYALIYVLFINLLIISALLAFLSLMFFYNIQSIKILSKTKLDWACYSAAQLAALDSINIKNSNYIIKVDSINVSVTENLFGLYKMITTSAKFNNDSSVYQCFFSTAIIPAFANSLVISHPNAAVTVAGETNISGNILLTSNNVTRGNIFGIRNSTENYLNGDVIINDSIKSNIYNASHVDELFDFKSPNIQWNNITLESTTVDRNFLSLNPPGQNYIVNGDLKIRDSLFNSDYRYYNFIVSGKVLFSSNCYSNINLIIRSSQDIVIDNNAHIENSILITKGKMNAEGTYAKTVQIYSEDSVSIKDSFFGYPSIILSYASAKDSAQLNRLVNINNSIINGTVMLLIPHIGMPNDKSKIFIDDQSKVQGLVYSENNVESSGKITGCVYTYNYWFYKDPGEYVNWLVNVNIDRKNLDKWFLTPVGFVGGNDYEMLDDKWIY